MQWPLSGMEVFAALVRLWDVKEASQLQLHAA